MGQLVPLISKTSEFLCIFLVKKSNMENRFERCCFDYDLIRSTTQCDRLNCEGNHNPAFDICFHKVNNECCYCLNHQQLAQYWRCYVQKNVINVMFVKKYLLFLPAYKIVIFYPNTTLAGAEKPYQPVKWRIFTATIKK